MRGRPGGGRVVVSADEEKWFEVTARVTLLAEDPGDAMAEVHKLLNGVRPGWYPIAMLSAQRTQDPIEKAREGVHGAT